MLTPLVELASSPAVKAADRYRVSKSEGGAAFDTPALAGAEPAGFVLPSENLGVCGSPASRRFTSALSAPGAATAPQPAVDAERFEREPFSAVRTMLVRLRLDHGPRTSRESLFRLA